jgi:type II secretory pathway predicted ATPase ExeA
MYRTYYGLAELPFELTSNPRFLFFTTRHREALANLEYGLSSAKAVTVLIGEAGTGKTTLLNAALASQRCRQVQCVYVNNPALTRAEFIELLAGKLQLGEQAAQSKAAFLGELETRLRERHAAGQLTALVVDEAQSLSNELLEEIRLLANIETAQTKLLPLVLAGQPELADRLNQPALRQLKQRVALRCDLEPLSLPETASYIATRIVAAGGVASRLFTREAVLHIHTVSRGIPRTISVICDNALVSGFALERKPVDREIVVEVCRDLDLEQPAESVAMAEAGDPTPLVAEVEPPEREPAAEPVREPLQIRGRTLFGASKG